MRNKMAWCIIFPINSSRMTRLIAMTALYKAGQALGLSEKQVEALLFFWDLPHRARHLDELESTLKERLHLSNKLVTQFIATLLNCTSHEGVHLQAFCQQLWEERNALEALALLQYFQQLYFTKTAIEESTTMPTQFTTLHAEQIQHLANAHFDMINRRITSSNADITLIIGSKAKTCDLYFRYFQSESTQHNLGKPYLFLSTRRLLRDKSDNPISQASFEYDQTGCQDYHDYLKTHYLERYNRFMSDFFHKTGMAIGFKPITEPTEGMAMFERYEYTFKESLEIALERNNACIVYTGKEDAFSFYQQALKLACAQGDLSKNGVVALGSLQPYLSYYAIQFDVIRNQSVECADVPTAALLSSLTSMAYGPDGMHDAHFLAQRLATIIDVQYKQAAKRLQRELGIVNAIPIPNEYLRINYSKQPLIFFCSSLGDAEFAKDTIRSLSEKSGKQCSIIALCHVVEPSLASFAALYPNVTMVREINDVLIKDCSNDEIVDFVKRATFSNAFIGMPSNNEETRAMQIALSLDIPVIFASEFMFEPPREHAIWQYHNLLCQKENIQFAVPLSGTSLFAGHPRRHIVGHRALSKMSSYIPMSIDQKHAILAQLNVISTDRLAVISGTTQPPGVDTEFLSTLLDELPKHPTVQLRFSIHPGVKQDMLIYINSLIAIAKQMDTGNQFKIILNDKIKEKLTPAQLAEFLAEPFIIETNVSGPDASSAADAIAQAVPGELVNTAASQGKPTFVTQADNHSLLPSSWVTNSSACFFTALPTKPHTLAELCLNEDLTEAEVITRLMLS